MKRILIHLLCLVGVCLLILFGTILFLNRYTRHNQAIRVPDLIGLDLDQADRTLTQSALRYEVIDSIFNRQQKPGSVLDQRPAAQSKVKMGRIIYLTLNSHQEKAVAVPYVKDYSQRQAVATLEATGFKVDKIVYVASEYRNLVLDVKLGDRSLESGTTLPIGTSLTLVVGQSRSYSRILMPNFIGMTLDSAFILAHSSSVNIGEVVYDETPTERNVNSYRIYEQSPAPNSSHAIGKRVDIWLSKENNAQF